MADERIVERIRKLLALAGNNDNAEEAASAASMATRLMEEHAICRADVEEGEEAVPEIVRDWFGPRLRKISSWQGFLGTVVAEACGCSTAWVGSRDGWGQKVSAQLVILGEEDDVRNAVQLRDFCHREIDRLTARHTRGRGRRWGVSFRTGCVMAIRDAARREREALREAMRGEVSETALVVMDQRKARADEAMGSTTEVRSNAETDRLAVAEGMVAGRHIYGQSKPRVEG